MTKVCIVGAGAVGGVIGAHLSAAGECEVSAIARGETLAALKQHGWRLIDGDKISHSKVKVSNSAKELGKQDVVILAVKAQAMPGIVGQVVELCGPETTVIPAMNGIPWWFGHGTAIGSEPLQSVDPEGRIASLIPIERVLGCVVHLSAGAVEPGLIRHVMGRKLIIGEAAQLEAVSERATGFGKLLGNAGFDVAVTADIRYDVWYKLWGNMTMTPISAVTGATMDQVLADPLVLQFCSEAMLEAQAIGNKFGCAIDQSPVDRHEITATLGAFKPSMLQDVEAGRSIELDALVAAVREIGQRLGCKTPTIDAILGITRLFARSHGLYPVSRR
jgi:2-dehydropantoate 2-reductase